MILKLGLLLSTIGVIACNVPFDTTKEVKYQETNEIHHRNYQHSEYLNSYTEVVYKYESNEVNQDSDLIVGNVYNFSCDSTLTLFDLVEEGYVSFQLLNVYDFHIESTDLTVDELLYSTESFVSGVYLFASGQDINLFSPGFNNGYVGVSIHYLDNTSFSFDALVIEYSNLYTDHIKDYFSYTEYNEIESVIYHQPQTIIGYFNEFLSENLFNEIPFVREMTFNIGGQNINLLTYLLIAFGLIVSVGLLIGLFLLLKWLFKVFANSFILR